MTGSGPLRFPAAALAAAAVLAAGACGKPDTSKVDAVKAHNAAKGMQEDLNRKAQENVDAIEKAAK